MLQPKVVREDAVFSVPDCASGAQPLWCFGNTILARDGDDVFISGVERVADAKPLNTLRWVLYQRTDSGWKAVQCDEQHLQREPCPTGLLDGGRLMMSVNPTLVPGEHAGPARPEVLEFNTADPTAPPKTHRPAWKGEPPFCEHSYRSFVVDRDSGEMLLMQNIGYTHAEMSLCDADGKWSSPGRIVWPWGHEYDKPYPVRICYPAVALRNRAAYVFGTSDILEPYVAWREYRESLGLPREYDFRRVFFNWTPDITSQPFGRWIELGSRDRTAGKLLATDMHIDDAGRAHVLWSEKAIDENLREKFFPGAKQWHALNYAVVEPDGKIEHCHLHYSDEDEAPTEVTSGRFHVAADGRLLVLYYVASKDSAVAGNYITEIGERFTFSKPQRLPLSTPMAMFMTTTTRGGNKPSNVIDMVGAPPDSYMTVNYAELHV